MKTAADILLSLGDGDTAASRISEAPSEIRPRDRIGRTTIYLWKHRKAIPSDWHPAVLWASRRYGARVTQDDLMLTALKRAA